MTPQALWIRYAAIWSALAGRRRDELAACLTEDATYCDPNGLITGRDSLSAYMGQFQETAPGCTFRIRSVLTHHDRTLANWSLIPPDGSELQKGTSFGHLSDDGRLRTISGFFYETGASEGGVSTSVTHGAT
ncbi:MAG: nuclear transport factor 2 family protein [Micropepsaceae bacterium]